ncbi:plasmid pRiA4b ORF-3 family protein [Pseudonocardia kunmingensis]|uniref:PRiA4b ORF-3-like protein n=1 Tax=Pseudonocardia kunmingensis TaxID=630975 RepID=A0A543DJZ9_9PSEU|nr:plasmid pRiA4b ORF-3 family protein [Pseudonocardia kunmingensis]TQM09667.1 pRiA4b ORF-3-like protein [Pseudonocardia kunmingensis]
MIRSFEVADAARRCRALSHAEALAEWVGSGRPVTGKRVLRRADVAAACAAVGVTAPERLRSAADLPDLQHPWTAALAAGLLSVEGSRAVPGPARPGWHSAPDGDVLAGWLRGLARVLADAYAEGDDADSLKIGRLLLTVLAADPAPARDDLYLTIVDVLHAADPALVRIFTRGLRDPMEAVMEQLAAFGTVDPDQWRITPLGRWALRQIGAHGVSLLGSSDAEGAVSGICEIKVTLRNVRPACWRRVLVPAEVTLGDLHEVIRIAFAWDDDHLHVFTVGPRRYGDPYFDFEYDEDAITLSAAFARTRKPITYVYDLGDSWEHEILLEKTVEPDASVTYPLCVDGRGDAPVEDWIEDEEPAWITFDQADINVRLARLSDGAQEIEVDLGSPTADGR